MKYIQLKYAGLQDDLRDGTFVMEYTKTEDNTADFLTKSLKNDSFSKHRESAGIVKYEKKIGSFALRSAGRKLVGCILVLQLSGADALVMNMDVDFMIHCWMFGLGAYISILAMIWAMLKFLWLTPCRHVLRSVVKMWDLMLKNFQIKTETDHHDDHPGRYNRIFPLQVRRQGPQANLVSIPQHIAPVVQRRELGADAVGLAVQLGRLHFERHGHDHGRRGAG